MCPTAPLFSPDRPKRGLLLADTASPCNKRKPAGRTCAMLRMCRSSAKLGGTYWRRDSAKNSSYSWNASTSLHADRCMHAGQACLGAMHALAQALFSRHTNPCSPHASDASWQDALQESHRRLPTGPPPLRSLAHWERRPHLGLPYLMGVKKLPMVGTIRRSRLCRGSVRCSVTQRSTFCMTCGMRSSCDFGQRTVALFPSWQQK